MTHPTDSSADDADAGTNAVVARNLFWGYKSFFFWGGGIKLIAVLTSFLPHKKFTWADFGGINTHIPSRRYAPGRRDGHHL